MRQLLRVVPIAIAVAFLVPAMTPAVVQAQSVDQQKQKVEDIVDELERLEEQALQLGEQYTDAIDTKNALDTEIADAEARIGEKEAELAKLRGNLSEMALRSFVGGGAAPLGPLFEDSDNLNDALQREELAKRSQKGRFNPEGDALPRVNLRCAVLWSCLCSRDSLDPTPAGCRCQCRVGIAAAARKRWAEYKKSQIAQQD